jgi:cobalt-zinc-cadmium efflux system outer membrane protein
MDVMHTSRVAVRLPDLPGHAQSVVTHKDRLKVHSRICPLSCTPLLLLLCAAPLPAFAAVGGTFAAQSHADLPRFSEPHTPRSTRSSAPAASLAALNRAPLTVTQAVQVALADNPGLAEMQARASALDAIAPQVSSLPDPVLSANLLNLPTDSFNLSQEPMTSVQIGLSQALPFPGKLALRGQAAAQQAQAASADVGEMRLTLVQDVRTLWWNLFYLDRALGIIERNQQLLRQFFEVAQVKYTLGDGLQQDTLLAQTELAKLLDGVIQLQGLRRSEQARLNALLNRPTLQAVVLPKSAAAPFQTLPSEQALLQMAEQNRPLLAAQRSRQAAAQTQVELAKKDYYPDFSVGVAYGKRSGNNPDQSSRADLASVMFSMTLPIYSGSKQDKALDQRNAQLNESHYAFADQRATTQRDVSVALAAVHQSRSQYELMRDGIIPQAQQTVAAMLSGYQVGKVDFLNLLTAQLNLYNYELQSWKAFSATQQALARLTAAVGKENFNE